MVQRLGCPVIYGVSANEASWWDNSEIGYLGWQPKDNAEKFRARIDQEMNPPSAQDVNSVYQGGAFCADGIHES